MGAHPRGFWTLKRWLYAMGACYVIALGIAFGLLIVRQPLEKFAVGPSETAMAEPVWKKPEAELSASGSPWPTLGEAAMTVGSDDAIPADIALDSDSSAIVSPAPLDQAVLAVPLQVTGCWMEDGTELPRSECDIPELVGPFIDGLYGAAEACRVSTVGEEARGSLRLGVELDIVKERASVWGVPGSTLREASSIAECARGNAPRLSKSKGAARARYQVAVSFSFAPALPRSDVASNVAPGASQTPKGEPGVVVGQRVRVRKSPSEDGEIIGRISAPSQVIVLERREDWCRVFTPNRNEGWMVCWALGPLPTTP
jgi:hypothetical protein